MVDIYTSPDFLAMMTSHWPLICSTLGPMSWTMPGDLWLEHPPLLPWMMHSNLNTDWLSHFSCGAWPWCCMTCIWLESTCLGMLAQSSIPNSCPALDHASLGQTCHCHWKPHTYHNWLAVGLHVLQCQQWACPWSGAKNIEECHGGHCTLIHNKKTLFLGSPG